MATCAGWLGTPHPRSRTGLKLGAVVLLVGMVMALVGCQDGGATSTAPESTGSNPTHAPAVVVIGDSLSTGYGTSPDSAWPHLIDTSNHATNGTLHVVNAAQNGSGYATIGDNNSTFGSQVEQSVDANTQLVLFFGSVNDIGTEPAAIAEAAAAAYAGAKSRAPGAGILAVGPPSYTETPDAGTLAVRDALVEAAGAAGVTFVDPIAAGWFLGRVPELVGPDGVHLSKAGQRYVQAQMTELIEKCRQTAPTSGTAIPSQRM